LIALCHQAEAEFGRTRNARWSARTLDVDLLCWDETIQPDQETAKSWIDAPPEVLHNKAPDQLILPHPRIQDRGFVLVPMADVAPNWRHPILGQTVVDMLARLPQAEIQAINAI
jgi:2-amino-4-hydroxy-6-hydroxymethyldihydropteridine diphosphokinase